MLGSPSDKPQILFEVGFTTEYYWCVKTVLVRKIGVSVYVGQEIITMNHRGLPKPRTLSAATLTRNATPNPKPSTLNLKRP